MIYDFGLSSLFVESKLDAAIQELDILFNTENTELLGDTRFGSNFEQFLWELNPAPNDVRKYIIEKITNYTLYANQLDTYVHVEVLNGEIRSIYHVIISITDPMTQEKRGRVYQFR